MANVTFNLREPNSNAKTAIYCVLRYNGKRVKIPSKISVNPNEWSTAKQKVKQSYGSSYADLNATLERYGTTSNGLYNTFVKENKREPEPKEIKTIIVNELHGSKDNGVTIPKEFYSYVEYFAKQQSNAFNKNTGRKISKVTIQNYQNLANKLKEFEVNTNTPITFKSISLTFYSDFISYLENQNYNLNTIGKFIKGIKTILNDATANGSNTNMIFKSTKFIVPKEQTTEIYLNKEQLKELENLDLSDNKRLDNARNLILVLCYSGQRYQSLRDVLNPNNSDGTFITIKQGKTSKDVVIPIFPPLRKILDNTNKLQVLSNVRLNLYIKEVCKMLPSFNILHEVEKTKGGKKIVSKVPFYSLVCTHTGRRTFATNFYNDKYDLSMIMAVTGHTKESTFLNYVRTTKQEHAQRMLKKYNEDVKRQNLKIA